MMVKNLKMRANSGGDYRSLNVVASGFKRDVLLSRGVVSAQLADGNSRNLFEED
jgi:hypothetical protein